LSRRSRAAAVLQQKGGGGARRQRLAPQAEGQAKLSPAGFVCAGASCGNGILTMLRQTFVRVVHATVGIPVAPRRGSARAAERDGGEARRQRCPQQTGGTAKPGGRGRCPGRQSCHPPGSFASRELKKPSHPADLGLVRVFRDAGVRSDSLDAPGATAPTPIRDGNFTPFPPMWLARPNPSGNRLWCREPGWGRR
jgi:hypothetical protein